MNSSGAGPLLRGPKHRLIICKVKRVTMASGYVQRDFWCKPTALGWIVSETIFQTAIHSFKISSVHFSSISAKPWRAARGITELRSRRSGPEQVGLVPGSKRARSTGPRSHSKHRSQHQRRHQRRWVLISKMARILF